MANIFKSIGDKLGLQSGPAPLEQDAIKTALSAVMDPDLHKDIVSLGFVKDIQVDGHKVFLAIELTTPACPAKDMMHREIVKRVSELRPGLEVEVKFSAQVPKQRRNMKADVAASLGQVKNIIAIASGKGGVGKSTSTVNLAYALASSGAKVGILDADIYGPSIPKMTGVGEPTTMAAQMVVPPEADGIKMISASMFGSQEKAQVLRGPMTAQIIRQFLTQVQWGELDYLLIDYPPGTGDIQLTLSQTIPLSGAVVVTTPQEVALLDVRKAVHMFSLTKVPILGVLETMSYFVCDSCDKKHPIFASGGGQKTAADLGVPLLGEVPLVPQVVTASDKGEPIVKADQESPAAVAFSAAAGKVAAQISILNAQEVHGGLMSFELSWQNAEGGRS